MPYDINQSQGPYYDGKNQMAGQPPLDQPLAPGDVPVAPDLPMMKRYSSHYEFPLSMLMAVMLHLFAVMVVLAYMAIAFYFGDPPPPAMEMVVFAGGGGDGDNSDQEYKPEVKEEIKFEIDPVKVIPPDVLPNKVIDKKEFQIEINKKRAGDIGKGGSGTGGGRGDGMGTGEGPGAGPGKASGARLNRGIRWVINMKYDHPESFIEKLSELKIVIGAAELNGRYLIFEDMPPAPPLKHVVMDQAKFQAFAQKLQRLWFQSSSRLTCENFAEGAQLNQRPIKVFMFIPQDLENAILDRELKYHGLKTEAEINQRKLQTTFDVKRAGSGWDVKVVKHVTDNTMKLDY